MRNLEIRQYQCQRGFLKFGTGIFSGKGIIGIGGSSQPGDGFGFWLGEGELLFIDSCSWDENKGGGVRQSLGS
jgi:hypothetical protein